jgi:hypothetical protein
VLFGLVANRALAPSSKLAAADWISNDVHIPGLPAVSDDACYRAMDWLHEIRRQVEQQVYHRVASRLDLESRPAVLRHDLDVLRAGGGRRGATAGLAR